MADPLIERSAVEYTADALGEILLMALPASSDRIVRAALSPLRAKITSWLSQWRIRRQLLEAARGAEADFRSKGLRELENDSLVQAVASFPLFDRELFQAALQTLPSHLTEDYLAGHLARYIDDDWKGRFAPAELRAGVALYMNCLRVRLLAVEEYRELVTQLAVLRADERTEKILASSEKLERMVQALLERTEFNGAIATTRSTIPEPVADFVGRVSQLEQLIRELAEGSRVVAISGMGGVGKTELARKLTNEIQASYPDGCISVELLGTSPQSLTWQDAMRQLLLPYIPSIRLPNDDGQLQGLFQTTFAGKKALLLLDDAAWPEQVRPLIPPLPSAAIITSRQHFSLAEFGLQRPIRLGVLSAEECSALLHSTSSRFASATEAQMRDVAKLCGGLPLALRMAGSLLNDQEGWYASTLIDRLENEATRLNRLSREGDPELNVEAALSLSYDLLPEEMKRRFRMLGVFTSWIWPLIAAGVWNISAVDQAQEALENLVSRNLLATVRVPGVSIKTEQLSAVDIFAIHDLTRLFASKLLIQDPSKAAEAVERHARMFLDLADYCAQLYAGGGELREKALGIFQSILPDLESALRRLRGEDTFWPQPSHSDMLLHMSKGQIQKLLEFVAPPRVAIHFYEGQLDAIRREEKQIKNQKDDWPLPDEAWVPAEAGVLINLGDAYSRANRPDLALACLESAKTVLDALKNVSPRGSMVAEAKLLGNMGSALFQQGKNEEALQKFRESLNLARRCDLITESTALGNIGNVYAERREDTIAMDYYEDQLALARRIGFKRDEAVALGNMATVFSQLGETLAATHLRMRAISISRDIGDLHIEGKFLSELSVSLVELGDSIKAVQAAEYGLELLRSSGSRTDEGACLVNLGTSYAQVGRSEDAVKAWTEGKRVLREVGYPEAKLAEMRLSKSISSVQDHPGEERSPRTMVARVIGGYRRRSPEAERMFKDMQALARDPTMAEDVRATARVLHQILAGVRNPDFASLPFSIAQAVVYHLEKPEISERSSIVGGLSIRNNLT